MTHNSNKILAKIPLNPWYEEEEKEEEEAQEEEEENQDGK